MAKIRLHPGRVQPVWAGHPWVFAQAVADVEGAPAPGDVVSVLDPRGNVLGKGFYSPRSAIPVRLLTRSPDQEVDTAFLTLRIEQAIARRRRVLGFPSSETDGFRLVHSEGDGLPGLVVDVYGQTAVVQFGTFGMKRREQEIVGALSRLTGAHTILEVPNLRAQKLEGFDGEGGVLRGDEALQALRFRERDIAWEVPTAVAQKTGFYFDQRENRAFVERHARDRRVLDLFTYVGGFAMAAARGGARSVLAVDRSSPALAAAAGALRHVGLESGVELLTADVKRLLPELSAQHRRFDLVVCDPPKLAPTRRHVDAARRAYRALNAAALKVVEPGGWLVTCSCSAAFRQDDFVRTLGMAARDARREVTIVDVRGQAPDHPVPAGFPEGRYLECVVAEVQ